MELTGRWHKSTVKNIIFNSFAKFIWDGIANPIYGHIIFFCLKERINKNELHLNAFEESCEIYSEASKFHSWKPVRYNPHIFL